MNLLTVLAKAVADYIRATDYGVTMEVEHTYLPTWDVAEKGNADTYYVHVTPVLEDTDNETRGRSYTTVRIQIGVTKKITEETNEQVEPAVDVAQAIKRSLLKRDIQGDELMARFLNAQWVVINAIDHMYETHTYGGAINVSYRLVDKS